MIQGRLKIKFLNKKGYKSSLPKQVVKIVKRIMIFRIVFQIKYNNFEMQQQQKSGSFIKKLASLLANPNYQEIICWDSSETMIDIIDQTRMENQIIPNYFRHSKLDSFIRQLNLYGFKKIKHKERQRFTHNKLLNGEKLNNITSNKNVKKVKEIAQRNEEQVVQNGLNSELIIKNEKRTKETVFSNVNSFCQNAGYQPQGCSYPSIQGPMPVVDPMHQNQLNLNYYNVFMIGNPMGYHSFFSPFNQCLIKQEQNSQSDS